MKKNNNGGFTLVELVVYMLVSAIVLVMVAQLLGTMNGMFVNTRNRNEAKQLGDTVYGYLVEELRYATDLVVHDPADGGGVGSSRLVVTSGRLSRNGSEVYSEEFYLGYQIEIETEQITAYSLGLTVRVRDSEAVELYQTVSTVECINIKLTGKRLEHSASLNINPTITYTRGTRA